MRCAEDIALPRSVQNTNSKRGRNVANTKRDWACLFYSSHLCKIRWNGPSSHCARFISAWLPLGNEKTSIVFVDHVVTCHSSPFLLLVPSCTMWSCGQWNFLLHVCGHLRRDLLHCCVMCNVCVSNAVVSTKWTRFKHLPRNLLKTRNQHIAPEHFCFF